MSPVRLCVLFRIADIAVPNVASVPVDCSHCDRPCWLSFSTLELAEAPGIMPELMCIQCFATSGRKVDIVVTNDRQTRELREATGNEHAAAEVAQLLGVPLVNLDAPRD